MGSGRIQVQPNGDEIDGSCVVFDNDNSQFCDYASAGNTWRRDNFYRTWFPVEYGPHE